MEETRAKVFAQILPLCRLGGEIFVILQRKDGGHPREDHRWRLTCFGGSSSDNARWNDPLAMLGERLLSQFESETAEFLADEAGPMIPWDSGLYDAEGRQQRTFIYPCLLDGREMEVYREGLRLPGEGESVVLSLPELELLLGRPELWLPGFHDLLTKALPTLLPK